MKRDILYVDDEPDNLIVFEATFESTFNVRTAGSGAKALDLLQRQAFPVVIADQRMPGMTGAELFEIMRRKYPHTKRVALTDRLVAIDRCAALGRSAARIAHEMGNQLSMLPLLELIEERYGQHEDLIETAAMARTTY